MATGRITKRTLDALLSAGVDGFIWDEDLRGFGLKTTSRGSASYVVQYRIGGREAVDLAFSNYADRFAASCKG